MNSDFVLGLFYGFVVAFSVMGLIVSRMLRQMRKDDEALFVDFRKQSDERFDKLINEQTQIFINNQQRLAQIRKYLGMSVEKSN